MSSQPQSMGGSDGTLGGSGLGGGDGTDSTGGWDSLTSAGMASVTGMDFAGSSSGGWDSLTSEGMASVKGIDFRASSNEGWDSLTSDGMASVKGMDFTASSLGGTNSAVSASDLPNRVTAKPIDDFGDFSSTTTTPGANVGGSGLSFSDMTAPLPDLPPTIGIASVPMSTVASSTSPSRSGSADFFSSFAPAAPANAGTDFGDFAAPSVSESKGEAEPNPASGVGNFGDFASSTAEPGGVSKLKDATTTGSSNGSFGDFTTASSADFGSFSSGGGAGPSAGLDMFAPPTVDQGGQSNGGDLFAGTMLAPTNNSVTNDGEWATSSSPSLSPQKTATPFGGGGGGGDKYAAFNMADSESATPKMSDLAPLVSGVS
jgi:hypothetical protein